jgi:hypothetical protein
MSSPDVTQYVDLSIYDRDPQLLFADALAGLSARLPGWVPREGNTEVLLLEALAEQVSYLIFAANRMPGSVTSVLLQLLGLSVSPGLPAVSTFQFNGSVDTGLTVPQGTRVQVSLGNGQFVTFATDVDLVVESGSSAGTVSATATEIGDTVHDVTVAAVVRIVDALVFVDGAELATVPSGGSFAETDSDFLDRGTERLLRLTEALVLASQMERYALEQPAVFRATAIDLYNPGDVNAPGDDTGHTTVAVAGTSGALLSTEAKAILEADIESRAHAGLNVHVVDADLVAIDVTVEVVRQSGATDGAVAVAVEAALAVALDPDAWMWGTSVYVNEVISLADGVTGVERVNSVTLGQDGGAQAAADVVIASYYPLTTSGTFTVTVVEP